MIVGAWTWLLDLLTADHFRPLTLIISELMDCDLVLNLRLRGLVVAGAWDVIIVGSFLLTLHGEGGTAVAEESGLRVVAWTWNVP